MTESLRYQFNSMLPYKKRSKGVAYVEFVDIKSVSRALGLTGHKMNGVPMVIEETGAEKNHAMRDEYAVQAGYTLQ